MDAALDGVNALLSACSSEVTERCCSAASRGEDIAVEEATLDEEGGTMGDRSSSSLWKMTRDVLCSCGLLIVCAVVVMRRRVAEGEEEREEGVNGNNG